MSTLTVVYATGAVQQLTGSFEEIDKLFEFYANQSTVRYALMVDQSDEYVGNEYCALAAGK